MDVMHTAAAASFRLTDPSKVPERHLLYPQVCSAELKHANNKLICRSSSLVTFLMELWDNCGGCVDYVTE